MQDANIKIKIQNKSTWSCARLRQKSWLKNVYLAPSSWHRPVVSQCQGESSRCGNNLGPTQLAGAPIHTLSKLPSIVSQRLKRSRGTGQLQHYGWVAEQQSQLVRNRREEWATRERQFPQESNPPHRETMFCLHRGGGGCLRRRTAPLGVRV